MVSRWGQKYDENAVKSKTLTQLLEDVNQRVINEGDSKRT